jgi:hypothetical protein
MCICVLARACMCEYVCVCVCVCIYVCVYIHICMCVYEPLSTHTVARGEVKALVVLGVFVANGRAGLDLLALLLAYAEGLLLWACMCVCVCVCVCKCVCQCICVCYTCVTRVL